MKTLIVAPHPDDETLGVGGTILRKKSEGETVAWLIITNMSISEGWTEQQIKSRKKEINKISKFYNFDKVFELNLPTTKLDNIPMSDLTSKISECFKLFEPEEIYIPHNADAHSDHRIVFDAVISSSKWFRLKSVKKILAYETLSETGFGLSRTNNFSPNVFVDISSFIKYKIKAMNIYESELGSPPFPRSEENIKALALIRGSESGYLAAEAFELLRERI
jgi:LmbE family N-acetylglucosaminyl deacetylase